MAPTEAERSSRTATIARIGAVVFGIALVSLLIIDQSRAVFTATTSNPDNAFTAASIELTDDDGGTALFTVPAMVPGDVVTDCIDVTYTGTADPALVKIYRNVYTDSDGATPPAAGGTLDDALTFNIDKVDNCASGANPVDVVDGTLKGNAGFRESLLLKMQSPHAEMQIRPPTVKLGRSRQHR